MSDQNGAASSRTVGDMSHAEVQAELGLVQTHLTPRPRQIVHDYLDRKITYEEAQKSIIRAQDEFVEQFPSRTAGRETGHS